MKTRSPFLNYIADYMLVRQYSLRTVDTYLRWIASYIHFHNKRHPASMGDNEVERYLEHLVLKQNVAPRTQATALNSLSFLYKHIIKNQRKALPTLDHPAQEAVIEKVKITVCVI